MLGRIADMPPHAENLGRGATTSRDKVQYFELFAQVPSLPGQDQVVLVGCTSVGLRKQRLGP